MSELDLLQAVRLKGRATDADLAATSGTPVDTVAADLQRLEDDGHIKYGKLSRITPEGREYLATLLTAERTTADSVKIADAYAQFRTVNAEFKTLISQWQLKNGEPNTHEDSDYDAAILSRLDAIDDQVQPIIAAVAAELPRLARYAHKLTDALAKLKAGDHSWFTRPIADSYHTVWFELHEELILASGLTRDEEAKAGHAQ